MGACGIGPFDNDDAADWLYELEKSADVDAARAALRAIGTEEYLEVPDCGVALAAAEVVAALNGRPHESLPQKSARGSLIINGYKLAERWMDSK